MHHKIAQQNDKCIPSIQLKSKSKTNYIHMKQF